MLAPLPKLETNKAVFP
ncbi:unnamed protein product, partial [Rotaria magnacalcarata]